jgi:PAS domain S-box-containing protein
VIFEDVKSKSKTNNPEAETVIIEEASSNKDRKIANLERELRAKEEYLQTTVEELETANEELKSTNEELQSMNEELQSTNEELETSKEELQSVNEELVTVNTELQQKIDQLSRLNNDMNNLLASTGIGTVFVDMQKCILRFTPAITRVINLIQTDVGRPLSHIASNLVNYENLEQDTQEVLDSLVTRESEVQTKNGLWFLMRILPYRTAENVIEGVVITFVEITKQKMLQDSCSEKEQIFKSVVENSDSLIWSIDANYKLIIGNSAFFENVRRTYHREVKTGEKMPPEWLPQPSNDEWKARYQRALEGESFKEEVITSIFGELSAFVYAFSPIVEGDDHVMGVSCNGRDVSDRLRTGEALRHLAAMKHDASDAIILHDLKGLILDWNQAAIKLFGWSDAEARSMNILAMTPDEEQDKAAKFLAHLENGEAADPIEMRFVNREGKELKVLLTATALVDERGKPYAATMTIHERRN